MTDFDAQALPEFATWRAQYDPPPDETAFLAQHMTVATAVLFAELMAPSFVLVEGCVILASRYSPDNFAQWRSAERGNVGAIESALNHLHLWDVFSPSGDAEQRALKVLAERIAASWALHARQQFPDRQFVAAVTDDYGPTVSIVQRLGTG